MRRKNRESFRIIIDSREQRPYRFENAVVKVLDAGDYSIEGLEDRVAIERKSKQDAYASLGTGRQRFEKELERLSHYDYAAIVIESSLSSFLDPPAFTKMNPKAAVNSLLSWSVKYGAHVFFACNRKHAKTVTLRLLEKFWKHRKEIDASQE